MLSSHFSFIDKPLNFETFNKWRMPAKQTHQFPLLILQNELGFIGTTKPTKHMYKHKQYIIHDIQHHTDYSSEPATYLIHHHTDLPQHTLYNTLCTTH